MRPFALLAVLVVQLGLTIVVPTLRVWRRTGTFPVVLQRRADPVQGLIGVVLAGFLAALLGWALLWAVAPHGALGIWPVPPTVTAAGWAAVGLGTLVELTAQLHMGSSWRVGIDDRPTALVTSGLFGLSRNPIFSGMLLSLLGVALLTPSPWTVMGFLLAACLIAIQVRLEEAHLFRLHGDAYSAYAAQVGRFLPWLGRLQRQTAEGSVAPERREGGRDSGFGAVGVEP